MNHSVLTGHLGADPETFFTGEGDAAASFNLAFKSGKDKTSWIKVNCYNRLAEVAAQYLHKGAKVAVAATLDQNKWENDKGESRSNHRLLANSIEFIKTDGRGFDGGQNPDETPFQ